ncbi:hypothetical protein AWC32_05845 [Mycobacterium xenopi]|nr:hypothetical protein AWC32_05845 [Mycobacterium xenopi]
MRLSNPHLIVYLKPAWFIVKVFNRVAMAAGISNSETLSVTKRGSRGQVPETVFRLDERCDVLTQGIAVGQHPREREEDAGDTQPRVTEQPTSRGKPAERQSRRGNQRVGVENTDQHEIDEEAFHAVLARRDVRAGGKR